ncbi:hypothetical protein Tco_1029076 [Tanacetum coccineum]|uniref:Uncharacterized protein n=1 Tax=Tanacetum coccineum TaxID=301880 RepID=A0ABQ5G2R3_9ASTR
MVVVSCKNLGEDQNYVSAFYKTNFWRSAEIVTDDDGSLRFMLLSMDTHCQYLRVGILEMFLNKTKQTYSSAYTKLIKVKKLEAQIRRRKIFLKEGFKTDEEIEKAQEEIKKELEQERLSFAEAIRIEEQMHEEQRAQIARDAEIARQWDEEERKNKKVVMVRPIFEKLWDFKSSLCFGQQ